LHGIFEEKMKWIVIVAALGALPIWIDPSWSGGVSAYEAIYNVSAKPQKKHISVEQALFECRQAYQESHLE